METFAEVRKHIIEKHTHFIDEPFQLGFDFAIEDGDLKARLAQVPGGAETDDAPTDDQGLPGAIGHTRGTS